MLFSSRQIQPGVPTAIQKIVTGLVLVFGLSGCPGGGGGGGSSQSISSGTLGLSISRVSGYGQVTTPSASWAQPLIVRVSSDGLPIANVPVTFSSSAADGGATVVNSTVTTNDSGYAQTSAVAPNVSNVQIRVKASLADGSSTDFVLETRSYPDTPTMTMADPVTLSTSYAQQTTVSVSIVDVSTAVKWCVSETQNSRPVDGNQSCTGGAGAFAGWTLSKPTSFSLSALNGVKTVYIWVADQFNQVSLNPSTASIYLDTVTPSIPFVTLSDVNSGSTTDTSASPVNLSVSNDGDAAYWCIISQLSTAPVPATPARDAACWVNNKPTQVGLAALGMNQVYIWTKDLAQNVSTTYGTQYINFTTLTIADPSFTISDAVTTSNTYVRSNTVALNITGDGTATKWCVSETQTTRPATTLFACSGGAGALNGWTNVRPTSFALSGGDGPKTVYVWVGNALNNTNTNPISQTITVDTVPPAIPIVDLTDPNTGLANFTNQSTVNLSITSDTDAVAWCLYEKASAAAPPSLPAYNDACFSGTRPTQVTLGATGSRRTYLYTKDLAQNVSPAPAVGMISYTTTPPSNPVGVLRDPDTNSTSLAKNQTVNLSINSPSGTVRWCVSETQTTKPATGTTTCTGGTGPSSGWFTTAPTTFALTAADGLKTVYLWVADGANNVNATAATTTITLDRTVPATPTVVISDPNSSSTTSTNQIIPTLAITNDTDAVAWCRIVQDTTAAAPATPAITDVCWTVTRPTSVVLDQTGTRMLYVFTKDSAGNVGSAGTATIDYSTTAPNDPSVILADSGTSLTNYANQGNVSLTISNDSDAVKWCVSETQTTRPSFGTSTCNGGLGGSAGWSTTKPSTWALSAGNGLKRVYVWTANASNTVNNNASSAAITRDQVLPATPVVGLSDPNTSSTSDTNQSVVTLSISNEDSDVTAWCVIEQAAAAAAPTSPAWSNGCWTTSKPVTASLGATGSRKVYVFFRDVAYNVSASPGFATIAYATTAPATPTLALSDGTTASASYIRQGAVAVAISGDTGATKWCLSESQSTRPTLGTSNCSGGTGASNGWLTSRPSTFTFPAGDGARTLYLWTSDVNNNTSASAVSASITLDTLTPSVAFVTLSDPYTTSTTITNQSTIDLSIQFDTDATKWCVIEQALATAVPSQPAWNSGCWVSPRPTTAALGATGTRRVFVFTKDAAQNVSPAAGVSQIIYSTTPPSDPSMVLTNSSTGSTTLTKDLVVTPGITSPTGTVRWCLSETQNSRPASGLSTCTGGAGPSSGWYTSLPGSFTLSGGDGPKTVYIWVADTTGNVNANTTTATITLDTAVPATPTVSMSDPNTGSTSKTNQFSVDLSITGDTDATKWCPIIQANAAAAPSTPALSDSCWKSSRPTTQLIDATGVRKLYVFTRDAAGNVGSSGVATMDYAILPPADPTVAVAHATTTLTDYALDQSLTLTITGDTNAVKWCVSEAQTTRPNLGTATCNGGAGPVDGWYTARPTTFSTSGTDALKRVYVWTADGYNNVNSNASSAAITLDTVVPATPSVTMQDPNTGSSTQTNQGTVTLNIGTTADALAWCVFEQASAAAAPSAPNFSNGCWVTTKPTTQALGATGTRKVYVYTRDRAYNISSSAAVATIDYSTTAPVTATLAVSDGTTSSTSYIRQVATAVSITGDTGATKWCLSQTQTTKPSLGTSTCNGGAGASNGWATTRPTSFSVASGDGAKTIYLWTADASNNVSATAATAAITLDTLNPAIPTVSLSDPNTSNTAFTNQGTVNLSITSDTDATKWCVIEQASATAAPSAPLYNDACWVGTRPTTAALGAQGARRAYVFTKDAAENVSLAAAIASISYSTTAPTDPGLVLTNATTGSRYYTNTTSVSVSINNPAGAVRWCLSETQSTRPATGTATCNGGAGPSSGWYDSMPSTFTLSSGDALKTVYIWVADGSNNTNANASSTTITLLQTPLAAPTVALADPNTASAVTTNQGTITMTITGDTGATAWCSIAQDAALADPAAPSTSDTCWNLTRPTSIALGATGNRKAFVFLRDAAMNVSSPGSASILLSTTAPADPTLALAHSVTGLSTYAKTTGLNITVGNDATAVRWCVSETQSVKPTLGTSPCAGGAGGSNGWYTARPTSYTTTAGDGTKRVYVWVANAANNVNDNAISTTIQLDTTAPNSFAIAGATGSGDTTADAWLGTTLVPTANWAASSGSTLYLVEIKDSAGSTTVCAQQTTTSTAFTFTGCNLVDGTTYKMYVTAQDDALNQTAATNNGFSFTVTLTPPGNFSIAGLTGGTDTTADQYSGSSLPTVSWTASSGVNSYLVRIFANDGFTVMCPQQTKASGVLSHDYSTSGCSALADNTLYKAEVVAIDVAGNSNAATNSVYVFRTDLSLPSVNITGNPASQSTSSAANFTFTSSDTISGVQAMQCKLDAGSYVACDSTTTHSYTGLADGSHTFTVKAVDLVGASQTASYTWSIDTVAPSAFTITGATGATDSTVDNQLRNDTEITANWNASGTASSYDVTILNGDDSVRCATVTKAAGSTSHAFTGCPIANPGSYKIKVVAKRGYGTTYDPGSYAVSAVRDSVTAVITATSNAINSGTSTTVTLVGYQNGVQLSSNVLNPTFSITGGVSSGTFGSVSYIGSGTYQVTFTGTTAGSQSQITASTSYFGGFTGITTADMTVSAGVVSPTVSTVTLSKSTIQADNADTTTVTVNLRDGSSNIITGASLSGALTTGTSTGVYSSFTESPSGTYTATISGRVAGTGSNVLITANTVNITGSQPALTVIAGPPVKIKVTGPSTSTTHTCTGPYTVSLNDYWNNTANATSNVQINFSGLTYGNFSMAANCSSTDTNTTIMLGMTTASSVYVMPRGPDPALTLSFVDAATTLTTGTINLAVTGVVSWLGQSSAFNWGTASGVPSRSGESGFVEPRGVWVNTSTNMVYVADTYNNRIVKLDATTKTFKGWVGFTESVGGIDCAPESNPSVNSKTPGWCKGGRSARTAPTGLTNWDGVLNLPSAITGDGTYLYVIDRGNNRIVRYLESTGEWKGWYGRAGATVATSCESGTPAANVATPDWCYGGNAKAYTTATANTTNWDQVFDFSCSSAPDLQSYYDNNESVRLLILTDTCAHRMVRMRISGANLIWEGWAGRVNYATGMTNGVNTAGCGTLATGDGTPGWCKGGTSQASFNSTQPGGCTATPGTCFSSQTPSTDYNNRFNTPQGIAIISSGTPALAYFSDTINGRLVRFNLTAGTTDAWVGRMIRDAGYQGTGGTNCTATTGADTGWCVGGVPQYQNYRYYTGTGTSYNPNGDNRPWLPIRIRRLDTDGTNLYAMLSDDRIVKFNTTNSQVGLSFEWIGRVAGAPTSGTIGCTTTPIGFATPGWCTGGSSNSGTLEGQFSTGYGFYIDTTNGKIYSTDIGNSKVQVHNLSTGASEGWIGTKPSSVTSWATTFTESLFGFVGFINQDATIGSGSITNYNANGQYLVVQGASGLYRDNTYLYVVDSANNRVKRHVATTGEFYGWYGKASAVPTGVSDGCTSIGAGGLTPDWCYGGTPGGMQIAMSTINDGTGELRVPHGIVADSSYMYISDTVKNRIVRVNVSSAAYSGWLGRAGGTVTGMSGFDATGITQCSGLAANAFTGAFCSGGTHSSGSADGMMNTPRGLAIDTTNKRLYVADSGNHRISMYSTANDSPSPGDLAGKFLGWIGRSTGAATAAGPTTSALNSTCTSLTSALTTPNWCLGAGGNTSSTANTALNFMGFNGPQGVAYDNNAIYVADTGAHRIQKFNATTGAHLGWIGRAAAAGSTPLGEGTGSGLTAGACTIALNAITPGWCYRGNSQASGTGAFDGAFNGPTALWVDPNTNFMYVVDAGNHRITKHNKVSGAFVGWRGLVDSQPTGGESTCSTTSQGNVTPGWCTGGTAQAGSKLGGFYNPVAITGDANFIYVTDTYNSRVVALPK